MKDNLTEDFADLDELLGEATKLQSLKQSGRDASSKLRRGNLREDEAEEALASVRAAEAIFTWETVTECAVVEEAHCLACNSVTEQFGGFYLLRRHRTDKGAKQMLRITTPSEPVVPTFRTTSFSTACPKCLSGTPLDSATVNEFAMLQKFCVGQ